jgi:hypothetical protein
VYSREIEGQEYTFGVSGKLIMNVLVMYDRQTDSLWAQLLGEAVEGPMKGTKLEFIPAVHTTWTDWKARHPDTLALVKGYSGAYSGYRDYFGSDRAGVLGEFVDDDRLYIKEFVIGVEQGGEAVAYPFGVLNEQPLVNDQVGGVPVLVVFDANTGAGVVYNRRVGDGRVLSFEHIEELILVDAETGTTWDGMSGLALEGPLAGARLRSVKSTASFWFGWKDWYPETRVYGLD